MAEPRLLTRQAAAELCGVGPSTFSSWVTRGIMPKAVPGTKRWDRRAIHSALDRASGLAKDDPAQPPEVDGSFDTWLRARGYASAAQGNP